MRGHKIRYNYLHNIHGFEGRGCNGVYLDDCFSSADISSNIFYDVANAILIGGGRDNIMTNNLFLNCRQAFSIDARGLGWAKGVGDFATRELLDLNYKQPPWSIRYPELLGILEDEPLAPKGNVMARNICWGGPWGWTEPKRPAVREVRGQPGRCGPRFAGKPPADFSLAADSPALKLGFKPIPFRRIGVYKSGTAPPGPWPRSCAAIPCPRRQAEAGPQGRPAAKVRHSPLAGRSDRGRGPDSGGVVRPQPRQRSRPAGGRRWREVQAPDPRVVGLG